MTTYSPFILCRADIESAAHYRTTFMSAAEAPVYLTLVTDDHWTCIHPSLVRPDRWGHTHCHSCGAQAWSLRFVAEGVLGDGTVGWAEGEAKRFHEAMRGQGVVVLDTRERQIIAAMRDEQAGIGRMPTPVAEPASETVAADINVDMKANNRRRNGMTVPSMAPIGHDWQPEPTA